MMRYVLQATIALSMPALDLPPEPNISVAPPRITVSHGWGRRVPTPVAEYAAPLTKALEAALRKLPVMQQGEGSIRAKLWIEPSGRVARLVIFSPGGDNANERVVRPEITSKLKLPPPPAGLPQPLQLKITARNP